MARICSKKGPRYPVYNDKRRYLSEFYGLRQQEHMFVRFTGLLKKMPTGGEGRQHNIVYGIG